MQAQADYPGKTITGYKTKSRFQHLTWPTSNCGTSQSPWPEKHTQPTLFQLDKDLLGPEPLCKTGSTSDLNLHISSHLSLHRINKIYPPKHLPPSPSTPQALPWIQPPYFTPPTLHITHHTSHELLLVPHDLPVKNFSFFLIFFYFSLIDRTHN